ncbi:extracellular solute-binding protein family 5 [Sulfobacillus acidophilus TPY]|uniref:ABC-type transporter, periplasmic subunit n=1 Tax=Sulfobacillus acidophilus (strain ATCC 700253 / DSM 10332 / NAL) TaxID=679936 RepID=G8TSA3_SULAD|nr:extracellular solute-binding protein family 5 [Sulfobacillus acidophilus TPY]AEW05515.1 ABC-type transporter, periplasmic subunit [Sulfobacillus acidophilus DSM 10332]
MKIVGLLRRGWLPSTVALASAAVLAGCGQSGTTTAASNAPQHALQVIPGLNGAFQDNFNPYSGSALSGTLGLIYQPLFYFNLVGTQVYPLIGKSYQWSNNNQTLTVTLRPNVKWSNGTPLTPADVVFSFDILKKFPALDTNGIWTHLTSVTAEGNQIVFQFKQPDVPFAYFILGQTYIVPEKIWSQFSNPATVTNQKPVGSGPYLATNFTPEVYTYEANPLYWGGEPKVHTLKYLDYSGNESATLALASNKIDWTDLFVPNINKVFVSKDPQYNHYWFSTGGTLFLYPNLANPLLSNLAVREAISAAINRPQLTNVGEYGYEPPATPTGLVLPPEKTWIDPQLPAQDTHFTFSPAKAVKILENAGYKRNAQGIFTAPNGTPLSFTIQVPAGWTDWDTDCSLMAQDLKQVGINATVEQLSFGAYYSDITTGHYQLAMSWSNMGPTPYYLYKSLLAPKNPGNFEGWSNPVTTAALTQYRTSSNPAVQRQAIYTLEKAVAANLPAIPLIYGATWYEYRTQYFTGWPSASNPYAQPAPYNYPAEAIVLTHLTPRS